MLAALAVRGYAQPIDAVRDSGIDLDQGTFELVALDEVVGKLVERTVEEVILVDIQGVYADEKPAVARDLPVERKTGAASDPELLEAGHVDKLVTYRRGLIKHIVKDLQARVEEKEKANARFIGNRPEEDFGGRQRTVGSRIDEGAGGGQTSVISRGGDWISLFTGRGGPRARSANFFTSRKILADCKTQPDACQASLAGPRWWKPVAICSVRSAFKPMLKLSRYGLPTNQNIREEPGKIRTASYASSTPLKSR